MSRETARPTIESTVLAAALAMTVGLVACGDRTAEGPEGRVEEAMAELEGMVPGGGDGNSCVAEYAERPCDLLTEELVRRELPDAPAELDQDRIESATYACKYSWPSERMVTMEVMGNSVEYEDDNVVLLSWIEAYEDDPQGRFRRSYLPTAEELDRAGEAFEEEFDKEAEERGLGEQEKEIGEGLGEGLMKGVSFEPVEGIGTMASVDHTHGQADLYVLDGDTNFQVSVNVSADDAEDRARAVAIAERILEACK